MPLSPRAIAVQGLGYSQHLVAVQGLAGISAEPVHGPGYWNLPLPRNLLGAQLADDELILLMAGGVAAMGLLD